MFSTNAAERRTLAKSACPSVHRNSERSASRAADRGPAMTTACQTQPNLLDTSSNATESTTALPRSTPHRDTQNHSPGRPGSPSHPSRTRHSKCSPSASAGRCGRAVAVCRSFARRNYGAQAISHVWPSGSAIYPEYPPHSRSTGTAMTRSPEAVAAVKTSSTRIRLSTLIAKVTPFQSESGMSLPGAASWPSRSSGQSASRVDPSDGPQATSREPPSQRTR